MTEIFSKSDETIPLKNIFIKLFDWFSYIKKKWLIIVLFSFLGGVIGFLYAMKQPKTFVAKLIFILEEGKNSGSNLGGLASLAGQFGVDFGNTSGGSVLTGDNILLYFKSPSLAKEVLLSTYNKNSTIADEYVRVYGLDKTWSKNENVNFDSFNKLYKSSNRTRLGDSLINVIISEINDSQFTVGKVDKKASFIEVIANMKDESLAKVYCERIVNRVVERYISIKTQRQKSTVDKLQKRVDSITSLLNQRTYISASMQNSTSIMDLNPLYKTGNTVKMETTMRDKAMLGTIFASVTQNLEIAKFTLNQETPVIQIIDSPTYPLKVQKASKSKSALFSAFFFFFFTIFCIFLIGYIKE